MTDNEAAENIIRQFAIYGEYESVNPFGGGHINSTYVSVWNQAGAKLRYIHQRINQRVFSRPGEVMENIERVTRHIRENARKRNLDDISRRTLTLVPAGDGKSWLRDAEGNWWRTYFFIEGSHALDLVSSSKEAFFLGGSIAGFQLQLADFEGNRLHETIPGFHNMKTRYRRFHEAVANDSFRRVEKAEAEISFMIDNEARGSALIDAIERGALPERICHNDAKINNILIDDKNSEALCVIDLDTVMPGTALFDLGDLIRTVTNRAQEDEQDLSKVDFNVEYLNALLSGYVSVARDFLVPAEVSLFCESGRNLTQIMGLRFLTDYLEGDHYYRISRPGHNLDRCRNQIALIKSMDKKWESARQIVNSLCGGIA